MQSIKIKSIKKIEKLDRYDLTVSATNNFFANGILIHNTSAVIGKVLCLKPLKWYETLLKKLKVNVQDRHYDLVYSSRNVIKNSDISPDAQHYYKKDVWLDTAKKVEPLLNKGETLYGEIVGYVEGDKAIQAMSGKPYDYGCKPGKNEFYIYRITQTNEDGKVMDLSTQQMVERVEIMGLKTVPILYSGYAKNKYPTLDLDQHWAENLLDKLKEEYIDKKCIICKSDVWDEGIVVRKEGLVIENFKLKSPKFVLGETEELDKGVVDMESAESQVIVSEEDVVE